MAVLASIASGNFSTSTTWGVVDPTSYSEVGSAGTALTTSFVSSAAFTPGAITISGMLVRLYTRQAATGTFSARLAIAGVAVTGTTVTCNITDFDAGGTVEGTAGNNGHWYTLKFTSPVTLSAATAYTLQMTSSNATQITMSRSATAADWDRGLITTTTQAPAASDTLFIIGNITAAATKNTITVTNDVTTATSTIFGKAYIADSGILDTPLTAATNFRLRFNDIVYITSGGSVTCGSNTSNRLPVDSTLTFDFQHASGGTGKGITRRSGSILRLWGADKTNFGWLNATINSGDTTLTLQATPTNWRNGDSIILGGTERVIATSGVKTLTANVTSSSVSFTTAVAATYTGNTGTTIDVIRAPVVNLTRNISIAGTDTTNVGYLWDQSTQTTGVIEMDCVQIINVGSTTITSSGFYYSGLCASQTFNNCSIYSTNTNGRAINTSSTNYTNFKVTNSVFALLNNAPLISTTNAASPTISYTGNALIGASGGHTINVASCDTTDNIAFNISTVAGIIVSDATNIKRTGQIKRNIVSSSAIGFNLTIKGAADGIIDSNVAYRNTTYGLIVVAFSSRFSNFYIFANSQMGIVMAGLIDCYFTGFSLNSSSGFAQPIGINISQTTGSTSNLFIDSSSFGNLSPHSTSDINLASATLNALKIICRNTNLASSTQVSNPSLMTDESYISVQKNLGVAGANLIYKAAGLLKTDSVIYDSSPVSMRITPTSATQSVFSNTKVIPISNGTAATGSVKIRKSVVGDGTAWNGTVVRVVQKASPAIGITSDSVLVTSSAGVGSWETLNFTTSTVTDNGCVELAIEVNGTLGWVNIDSWAVN